MVQGNDSRGLLAFNLSTESEGFPKLQTQSKRQTQCWGTAVVEILVPVYRGLSRIRMVGD